MMNSDESKAWGLGYRAGYYKLGERTKLKGHLRLMWYAGYRAGQLGYRMYFGWSRWSDSAEAKKLRESIWGRWGKHRADYTLQRHPTSPANWGRARVRKSPLDYEFDEFRYETDPDFYEDVC